MLPFTAYKTHQSEFETIKIYTETILKLYYCNDSEPGVSPALMILDLVVRKSVFLSYNRLPTKLESP